MSQRIGNLPANINIMNPVPNKDAKTIMKLIRAERQDLRLPAFGWHGAFQADGVALAKQGAASAAWRLRAATAVNICEHTGTAARRATI